MLLAGFSGEEAVPTGLHSLLHDWEVGCCVPSGPRYGVASNLSAAVSMVELGGDLPRRSRCPNRESRDQGWKQVNVNARQTLQMRTWIEVCEGISGHAPLAGQPPAGCQACAHV